MCYSIKFQILPQGNFEKAQQRILLPSGSFFYWQGTFPEYKLTDRFCACRFIKKEGRSVIELPEIFENLLSSLSVKRVKVIWYWGENFNKICPEKKLTLSEFITSNHQEKLAPEIFYNINDQKKYFLNDS